MKGQSIVSLALVALASGAYAAPLQGREAFVNVGQGYKLASRENAAQSVQFIPS
jgi:hypothetical protein